MASRVDSKKASARESKARGGAKKKEEKPFVGTVRGEEVTYPPGIEMVTYTYKKRDRAEYKALRQTFDSSVRGDFLKNLGETKEKELKAAGFDDADIKRIKAGLCPEGTQVHHKKSLDDNGTNDYGNLVLIRQDPFHIGITNEQRELTGDLEVGQSKSVSFPVPKGDIYPATRPAA
jgi:hypothetical protein